MKVIYLASGKAKLNYSNVTYNDLLIKRDIQCDMMDVDLEPYEFLIATPPCNYYSRANYRRETSEYSQITKHLLPDILEKFIRQKKPFIVENVINKKLMCDIIRNFPFQYIEHGRHCYFTNINGARKIIKMVTQDNDNVQDKTSSKRQGGDNVNRVFEAMIKWLGGYGCCLEEVKDDEI